MITKLTPYQTILSACQNIRVDEVPFKDAFGQARARWKFFKIGDEPSVPVKDIFIEIIGTSTKGTIAKINSVEVDFNTYAGHNEIHSYYGKLTYKIDGRSQIGRIAMSHVKILEGSHTTKYVRNVTKHKKVIISNPVNKYKQEMKKGDWVIGVRPGGRLGIGRITRWTAHNVWGVRGDDLDDKAKEFKFDSISQTFTMPDDKHTQALTLAVLKGWNGC